ncbi:RNA polymerase sigma factor [Kordiimonas aquimaris]|uniref:RNA polymerase sigma factor n=1 Tax=Kordiimonas aquimaris TaxID=707591 RepID=UPI0021D22587|nr:RNA polymerase sigma factor [Kordiimonas aquimaris]
MNDAMDVLLQGKQDTRDYINHTALRDIDVVRWVLEGEVDAFEVIMRRYNQRLFRIARGILRNDTDAEDAVQEAYINAYLNLKQFSQKHSFVGWLTKITVNQALSKKRFAVRKDNLEESIGWDEAKTKANVMTDDILPDRLADSNALRKLIEQAIDSLPEEFRIVFIMRVIEQFSVRETAQALSLEEATVKTRQFRAVRRLREQLDKMYDMQINQAFSFAGTRCDRIVNKTLNQIRNL